MHNWWELNQKVKPEKLYSLVYDKIMDELLITNIAHFQRIRMPRTILKPEAMLDINNIFSPSKFVCCQFFKFYGDLSKLSIVF
jgi:hypothetical protein